MGEGEGGKEIRLDGKVGFTDAQTYEISLGVSIATYCVGTTAPKLGKVPSVGSSGATDCATQKLGSCDTNCWLG